MRKVPKVIKNCVTCNKSFSVFPSQAERRINCSKACNLEWQKTRTGEINGNWKGGAITSICPICETAFAAKRNGKVQQRFCSTKCADINLSNTRTGGGKGLPFSQRRCASCGSVFGLERMVNGNFSNMQYCSSECRSDGVRNKRQGSRIVRCIQCNKEFRATYSSRPNAAYCSYICKSEHKNIEVECEWCHKQTSKPISHTGYQHHFCSDEHRIYWLNSERSEPTQAEMAMQVVLDEMQIDYEFQHPYGPYILDFALLDQKINLEVDSEYHHALPGRPEHDTKRDHYMYDLGWEVIRIPSYDLSRPDKVKAKLAAFLDSYQPYASMNSW